VSCTRSATRLGFKATRSQRAVSAVAQRGSSFSERIANVGRKKHKQPKLQAWAERDRRWERIRRGQELVETLPTYKPVSQRFECADCGKKDIPVSLGALWPDGLVCQACNGGRQDLQKFHERNP
jgi:hypothetical protein